MAVQPIVEEGEAPHWSTVCWCAQASSASSGSSISQAVTRYGRALRSPWWRGSSACTTGPWPGLSAQRAGWFGRGGVGSHDSGLICLELRRV